MTSSTSHPSNRSSRGFTIVELMVSVGIMLAISAIIAFNQSHYSSGAELKNITNDLSLSLRQAQVYGISVKEFSPGSNDFDVGYGVEFNLTGAGSNNAYLFFADRGVQNSMYDNGWYCPIGGDSECLDKVTLGKNNRIQALCVIDTSGNDIDCTVTRLDITFVRPATEAHFVVNGNVSGSSGVKGVRVKLASVDGTKTNSLTVYITGQISVK